MNAIEMEAEVNPLLDALRAEFAAAMSELVPYLRRSAYRYRLACRGRYERHETDVHSVGSCADRRLARLLMLCNAVREFLADWEFFGIGPDLVDRPTAVLLEAARLPDDTREASGRRILAVEAAARLFG